MIAHVCKFEVGDFVHTLGDAHIYSNHLEQVRTQLERSPLTLPTVSLNEMVTDIFKFKYEDIIISDYKAHPHIKAKVAV